MSTPDILQNELVKKYFGDHCQCISSTNQGEDCMGKMAFRILRAVQEPVVEGKLYLAISEYGKVTGPIEFTSTDHHKYHGHWLVLPSRFQPPPESKGTATCEHMKCCGHCQPRAHDCECHKPAPVVEKQKDEMERKLQEVARCFHGFGWKHSEIIERLRELISVARSSKKQ